MKKYLAAAALALATIAAAPASAADVTIVLGPGAGSYDFGNNSNAPGAINDTYTFTVPAGMTSGFVGSFALGAALDVTLTSVKLDNTPFTQTSAGAFDLFQLNPTTLTAGTHVITVLGTWGSAGGSYAGTVNFAPTVPEPATWAMMIGGFGLAGGMMRRRATKVAFA